MRVSIFCALVIALLATDVGHAQSRSLLNTQLPAGEIGSTQVLRRPELAHVQQPVLIRVPDGATLSLAEGGGFSLGEPEAQLVSLQVGATYRLKVSNIPNNYGDVYPTIELVDRLHAPPGKETRYPVPVEITAEELTMALSGKFVTRVIYVEDPRNAVGARELPEQRYFEALPDEDPYEVASRIGRPIAILRMGSVLPNVKHMSEFLFGSPPLQRHQLWPKRPTYTPSELKPEDLPAEPDKRKPLPEKPEVPDAIVEQPEVPEDLPTRKQVDEQPDLQADEIETFNEIEDEEGMPEDAAEDAVDSEMPAPSELDDDPFADFE